MEAGDASADTRIGRQARAAETGPRKAGSGESKSDQREPREPQPGSRFRVRLRLTFASPRAGSQPDPGLHALASQRAARRGSARGRLRGQPAEAAGDRDRGARRATKIHASARASRSGGTAPPPGSARSTPSTNSCTSRRCRRRYLRISGRRPPRSAPGATAGDRERCSLNSKNALAIACIHARGSCSVATASSQARRTLPRPRRCRRGRGACFEMKWR